ncbi:ABC-type multidrug transport system, ATPase and permease component [Desulfosporosinus orientis DSM 765]|uniref:ABC-type multidrug transport system, ATPase and permease component n=1 Tax=Desulfosporosinus orientis (strain ATCC 19365 / DSM 765 / NCIMB 8382 / VKM B-1628 / Singapore I) TaxID=768706 RepID=G7WF80_DESOD|nr:ABC-type multidrug transport system, ATPase and permease component [Desulfosporosinus orientis DSM 765]
MLLFKDLMWFFKQEKKGYILGIIILVLVALLNLLPPYVVRVIVDEVSRGALRPESLLYWTLILAGIGLAVYALRFSWRLMILGAESRLSRLLRKQLFDHFTLMSPQFYQKHRTGDLMAHARFRLVVQHS